MKTNLQKTSANIIQSITILLVSLVSITENLSAQQKQPANNPSSTGNALTFWDSVGGGKPVSLYNGKVPNSKIGPASYKETNDKAWSRKVTDPEMIPFLPDPGKRTGTAIVIFPGGGYSGLSVLNEGANIAKAFKDAGIAAFVVKYRLPSDSIMVDKSVGPLQDAQQALMLVRMNATKYGIDPGKVGVIGFSAGGHLASTVETHFDMTTIANEEKINLRPDFAMLMYPVVSFGKYAHRGSRKALVGNDSVGPLAKRYSNELQVTERTPPTFLVHATDDNVVPVENSLLFYQALLEHKVTKSSMFIFQEGGHGFGLNNKKTSTRWFDLALEWLKLNGF
ncbi:alpha/beta hydrolase [Flavitalea sp.]|nr:alpha/beta hydrolase [Flavitalea sp.]